MLFRSCLKTSKVKEFVDPVIEERIQDIARENGYEISGHNLVIYGTLKEEA